MAEMFDSSLDIIIFILGCAVLLTALISMQVKKLHYLVILQSISNGFAVAQYSLRSEISSVIICSLGAILTLVVFFYDRKEKRVPSPIVIAFSAAGIAVTLTVIFMNGAFSPRSDIIPLLAWIVFNLAMMQSKSWIARVLMMSNSSLWLILNLINFDLSLAVTYAVLVVTSIIGIIRLDRREWRAFFARILGGRTEKREGDEEICEKSEENV